MGYVFGIIILVLISLWTGFVIGVIICTEVQEIDRTSQNKIDRRSQRKKVSRETSQKGKANDE